MQTIYYSNTNNFYMNTNSSVSYKYKKKLDTHNWFLGLATCLIL